MIDIGDKKLIIDAGPDFRTQMLRAGVKDVTALLLTHEHKDHIGGLDDIRAFNWVKNGEVDIYCNQRTKDVISKDYDYAFAAFRYPGVPEMNIHVIDEEPFWIGEIKIEPITVMHYKLSVTAFRIDNFAYITDANFISEASMKTLHVKQAYITHIGHQMGLHEEVSRELPENIQLAHDMLSFEF